MIGLSIVKAMEKYFDIVKHAGTGNYRQTEERARSTQRLRRVAVRSSRVRGGSEPRLESEIHSEASRGLPEDCPGLASGRPLHLGAQESSSPRASRG